MKNLIVYKVDYANKDEDYDNATYFALPINHEA